MATDLVIAIQIGVTGFEPATSWSQTTRSTKLSYTPVYQAKLHPGSWFDEYHALQPGAS